MGLQQNIIRRLMTTLSNSFIQNPTTLLDTGVLAVKSQYTSFQEVIDDSIRKMKSTTSYKKYLNKYCDIVLSNDDTGAVGGRDAIGGNSKNSEDIVPEKSIDEWFMPPQTFSFGNGGLVVHFPDMSTLTTEEQFICGGLATWWIPEALDMIQHSYGLNFDKKEATPKELTVVMVHTGDPTVGASVASYYDMSTYPQTGLPNYLELQVNMDAYSDIDITNPNGKTATGPFADYYLDRTIAHEMVHATMSANIPFFKDLPLWFTEGAAELIHGCDDVRYGDIVALAQDPQRYEDSFTSSAQGIDYYASGYMILRFFMYQSMKFMTKLHATKTSRMSETGVVYSLKELGQKFMAFLKRSRLNIQPWELLDDRLSTFYGATLRIPIYHYEDFDSEEEYYALGDTLFEMHGGAYHPLFLDKAKARYPKISITKNASLSGLQDVFNAIDNYPMTAVSHVYFNGIEADIDSGMTAPQILANVVAIKQKCFDLDALPTLIFTPKPSMYNSEYELNPAYTAVMRHIAFTGRPTLLLVGDDIVDYYSIGGQSWSICDTVQEMLPKAFVVNKGVAGDKISDVVARFQTDVLDEIPTMCAIIVGMNDLWTASMNDIATLAQDYINLAILCKANNIEPVVFKYDMTLEQIETYCDMYGTPSWNTPVQILYYYKCMAELVEVVAKTNNVIFLSAYHDVIDKKGYIVDTMVASDKVHLSKEGARAVGHYIATAVKERLQQLIEGQDNYKFRFVNLYEILRQSLKVDVIPKSVLETYMCEGGAIHYSHELQDMLSEYMLTNRYLAPSNVPYFYVSLEHMDVTNTLYTSWLRTETVIEHRREGISYKTSTTDEYSSLPYSQIYYQSEKYNHATRVMGGSNGAIRTVYSKYNTGANRENIFKNTGEFLAVGLHTLYDANLWMCEQGGITCEKEAQAQINDLNLLPARTTLTNPDAVVNPTSEGPNVALPVFPGTGCPWLTMSDEDKSFFNVAKTGLKYWFTKTDYAATISFGTNSGGYQTDRYQTISLGRMDTTDCDSYLFPLYVAGGNQALVQDIFIYTPVRSSRPTYRFGNSFDLGMRNIAMANSNLLHPTKFNGANMSNFRVMSPEGVWKDVYAHEQTAYVETVPGDPPSNWYAYLNPPTQSMGAGYHTAFPFMDDRRYMIDTFTVKKAFNIYDHSSYLNKVSVCLNPSLAHEETGVVGTLPNVFASWYRKAPIGEIELSGNRFLSIPNGWDERYWDYYEVTNLPEFVTPEDLIAFFEDLNNPLKQKKIMTRLLIPLEEG